MKILITGATGNIGKGIIPRLLASGHELVLSDVNSPPNDEPFFGLPFVQCDVQAGFGLERAVAGCDLIVHLPAWHGIHWQKKTEVDYWRLNVDGTFYIFQAAIAAGVKRMLFLSSMAWHGHYDKYGFTKVIGEELCEYNRRNHGIAYIAVRPADLTPFTNFLHYGSRLLYGGVDRDDVLDAIEKSISYLSAQHQNDIANAPGFFVNAVRPNSFTAEQISNWEADPESAAELLFPRAKRLIQKYGLDVRAKPSLTDLGSGAETVGYSPSRHFGTFIETLSALDAAGDEESIRTITCPY